MARLKRLPASTSTLTQIQPSDLRLNAFNSKLTDFQRQLFDAFWEHHQAHGKWPSTRVLHSKLGTQKVREALRLIGGDIIRESENPPNDTYELSLIGILMTSEGEKYRRLLLQYIEFLREQFISNPEKVDFKDEEIQRALSLSATETGLLGKLTRFGNIFGVIGWSENSWVIRSPKEIEYLPSHEPLDASLDEWLFRHFQHRPVLAEDTRQQWNQRTALQKATARAVNPDKSNSAPIDALKRRYQVFVSSTYEDLKEERQHVIQALLETKCIPLGMELFPAASIEQWELIKRVIDECDYYIVIIAGRYGSLNEAQVGYTEMEFDYALSTEKPVIGFYHKTPENLPVAKSEKTDAGRERLKKFTEKVKQKVCRPWVSAAELGSAVKSAILHELEFNPKPGWIRADAVNSSEHVEKLKQRIADLEERLKKKVSPEAAISGVEANVRLPFAVIVKLDNPEGGDVLNTEVSFKWDEIFAVCAGYFKGAEGWSENLRRAFPDLVQDRIRAAVLAQFPKAEFIEASIAREEFEDVLHTFVAEKLLKVTSNGWTDSYGAFLKMTEKGLHRMSEAKVKRKRSSNAITSRQGE